MAGPGEKPPTTIEKPSTNHKQDEPLQSDAEWQLVNTAELLEHILSFLPAKQLIQARAVSRGFRDLIDSSPQLKHATFLKSEGVLDLGQHYRRSELSEEFDAVHGTATSEDADGAEEIDTEIEDVDITTKGAPQHLLWIFDRKDNSITTTPCNPTEAFGRKDFAPSYRSWRRQLDEMRHNGQARPLSAFAVGLNPAIPSPQFDGRHDLCQSCRIGTEIYDRFSYQDSSHPGSSFLKGHLPNPAAKFWDMFVTQPAITSCHVSVFCDKGRSRVPKLSQATVYEPEGVRVRDILIALSGAGMDVGYGRAARSRAWEHLTIRLGGAIAVSADDVRDVERGAFGLRGPGTWRVCKECGMLGEHCDWQGHDAENAAREQRGEV